MSAGDTMQGRRIPDGEWLHEGPNDGLREAGDYGLTADGALWFVAPDGLQGRLTAPPWDFIRVEDDGTITVSPSIWVNKHADPPGWHGFLEHGVWRQV